MLCFVFAYNLLVSATIVHYFIVVHVTCICSASFYYNTQLSCIVWCDYIQLFMLCMHIYNFLALFMAIYNFLVLCMPIYNFLALCMPICNFPLLHMPVKECMMWHRSVCFTALLSKVCYNICILCVNFSISITVCHISRVLGITCRHLTTSNICHSSSLSPTPKLRIFKTLLH